MSSPDTDLGFSQPAHPLEPFVFHRPQYHNGLLSAPERLNERRIRMAMMAYGDGPDSLIKMSPEQLHLRLTGSRLLIEGASEFEPLRIEWYEQHEEIESVYVLIRFRQSYVDKLLAYSQQKIHPRAEIPDVGSSLVDLNKKS